MTSEVHIFESDHLTHVSNYSGVFDPNVNYEKFDFVYNTGDGAFYYARNNIAQGEGLFIETGYRFTLDPDGSTYGGLPTHYIYDELNDDQSFSVGQSLYMSGSLSGSDGQYNIISLEKDYEVEIVLPSGNHLLSVLDSQSLNNDWYESSWFFKANAGTNNSIDEPQFYAPDGNWVYSVFWGWIYVSLANVTQKEFWFYSEIGGGMWFWASDQFLGSSGTSPNSFVYLDDSGDSSLGPSGWLEWFGVDPFEVDENNEYYPFQVEGNYTQAIVYLGSKKNENIVTSSWNDGSLSISKGEYSALPEYTQLRRRGSTKWIVLGKDAFIFGYKALVKNNSNNKFYGFTSNNSFEEIDDPLVVTNTPPTVALPDRVGSQKKLKIEVVGIDSLTTINGYEAYSQNSLSISSVEQDITNNPDNWSKDLFFFDADYGSNVSFKANNYKYEYGNGYYILQPKNINSLSVQIDLKFKNRTNKEANAIVHFLENHQGQHQQDVESTKLKYNLGISGFRWDGASTFHPYDSTEVQSKEFFSREWSHSLNFENSNDINVKLVNMDSSILQKTSGLFVYPAQEYSDLEYYEKNDVVYSTGNKRHYYWSGDSSLSGFAPSQNRSKWDRNGGYYQDINTHLWTRDFFWKPSLGLNVDQSPKAMEVGIGDGYTKIFSEGINNSLLTLDVNFNNRSDSEAKAILHFLEQHYGCTPFNFTPPAPYDTRQNFVCQEWSHVYNYKNNHSISAKFEQYPLNLEADKYDAVITPSPRVTGELSIESPLVMHQKNSSHKLEPADPFRSKLILKNIGDTPIDLNYCSIFNDNGIQFSILGQENNDVPMVSKNLISSDYRYTLPLSGTLPSGSELSDESSPGINLYGAEIILQKGFLEGPEGGYMFSLQDGTKSFIQYNNGLIVDLETRDSLQTDYFINYDFITGNKTNILSGGESSDIEIVFNGVNEADLYYNLLDASGDSLIYMSDTNPSTISGNILYADFYRYYEGNILISGNYLNSPKEGLFKIYLDL